MRRWLVGLVAIVVLGSAALMLSPWPSVYPIRFVFDRGAAAAAAKLEKHVPPSIGTITSRYDPADKDAVLDAYRSPQPKPDAPTASARSAA